MKKGVSIFVFFICFFVFPQSEKTKEFNFSTLEMTPIYKGCEDLESNFARKKCMDVALKKHIQTNFDYKIVNCLKQKTIYNRKEGPQKKCFPVLLPGEKRIYLDFKISKTGNIESITARAPHEKLREETIRVGELIPEMIPAKQNGESVELNYTVPIDFTVK